MEYNPDLADQYSDNGTELVEAQLCTKGIDCCGNNIKVERIRFVAVLNRILDAQSLTDVHMIAQHELRQDLYSSIQ